MQIPLRVPAPWSWALKGARLSLTRFHACCTARRAASAAAVVRKASGSPSESPKYQLSEADVKRIAFQRNIGVSAHIDSGKTTLTERILYYTGRIRDIHEVRGRDAVGAKMDSMELEREKGITIQSAATFCDWNTSSLITGHVDFTIEVERALRVLDGAILSQTTTVDRQMRRYNMDRSVDIHFDYFHTPNILRRPGANPWRVINQIRTKLKIAAAAVQVPIGVEDELTGVVDLVRWKAVYKLKERKGTINVVESDDIPAGVLALAKAKPEVDQEIGDLVLCDETPTNTQIAEAYSFSPVFLGSAIKNTAVQPLIRRRVFLPANPAESTLLRQPLVALAFKLEEGRFGQLTYMRVYQGTLKKGSHVFNARTDRKVKVPRLVRMHSNEMEDIDSIGPGEICAVFGVECSSGDTFTDGTTSLSMTSMYVPEPVISLAIKPIGQETPNFSRALGRFQKEDPTFKVHIDPESKETIISGMGELHLEIYVERMRREYNVACTTGKPRVAYRETITQRANFHFTHKKQTGGAVGRDTQFESLIMGGAIPSNYIPACEKGFFEALEKGSLSGNPTVGCRMVLQDGSYHIVDSSELAFRIATISAFREIYTQTRPIILEPIMTVEVVAPSEFQSAVIGSLNQRRGTILDSEVRDEEFVCTAEVPLNDMFGYSSQLRGVTQGKGEFSMEYKTHMPVLPNVQKELAEAYRKTLPQAKK
ncbi:P-loop containing nucleoside triphosphate hydrolase protein [Pisolithus marmoratus]|nr:P-loop containing nucleoside triphosphate hydrolase protein [Pisolithus marmoratus]